MKQIRLLTWTAYLLVITLCASFTFITIRNTYLLEVQIINERFQNEFSEIKMKLDAEVLNAKSNLDFLEAYLNQRLSGKVPFHSEEFQSILSPLISSRFNQFNLYFAFEKELALKYFKRPAMAYTVHKDRRLIDTKDFNKPQNFILTLFDDPIYQTATSERWYHDAKKGPGIKITPIYFDTHYQKVWMFSVVKGLYQNNKFVGMVGVDILLPTFLQQLSANHLAHKGLLALLDNNSRKIFTKNNSNISLKKLIPDELENIPGKINFNREISLNNEGRTLLLNSLPLNHFDWTIVSLNDRDVVYAEVFRKVKYTLLISLLILVFNFLLIRYILKGLNRVYEELLTQHHTTGIISMSGGLAHEINNPLSVMSLSLQLIRRSLHSTTDRSNVETLLEKSEKAADRIQLLLKRLQNLSLNSKKNVIQKVNFNELMEELKTAMAQDLATYNINFISEIAASQEGSILCHPVSMLQVLLDLGKNSVEAIKDQKEKWIRVQLQKRGQKVIIRFIDSGCRKKSRLSEKMFLPFFTTKGENLNKGLGLTSARTIIEAQSGKLVFDNEARNTTFHIILPLTLSSEKIQQ